MKKLLIAALVAVTTIATAEAQCALINPGTIMINHRVGLLYGRNFGARVSCTRNTPTWVYWRGGYMCAGRSFYGRSSLGSFSCRVRGFFRR